MNRWLLGIILVVVALGGVGTAQADYADGQRAWDAGRHGDALREWQAVGQCRRRQGDVGAWGVSTCRVWVYRKITCKRICGSPWRRAGSKRRR